MSIEWQNVQFNEKYSLEEAEKNIRLLGDGWRLPSVRELSTLIDYNAVNPASAKTDIQSNWYWTRNHHAQTATDAWAINFYHGSVGAFPKSFKFYVLCCRDVN